MPDPRRHCRLHLSSCEVSPFERGVEGLTGAFDAVCTRFHLCFFGLQLAVGQHETVLGCKSEVFLFVAMYGTQLTFHAIHPTTEISGLSIDFTPQHHAHIGPIDAFLNVR